MDDMSGMDMSGMNHSMHHNMGSGSNSNSSMTNMTMTGSMDSSMSGMSMSGSNNNNNNNMCMVMLNGFQFTMGASDNCILFLFPFSPVDTRTRYAFAIMGTFFLCIAFEFLRAGRERMIKAKAPFGFLKSHHHSELTMDTLSAVSYGIQVWIGYWIMLLVMLYEAFIFIAIVSGVATGYFLVLRVTRAVDRYEKRKQQQFDGSDDYNNHFEKQQQQRSAGNTIKACSSNDADSVDNLTSSPTPCCSHP